MLEELRRHREMVQRRIQKSFESDGLDLNILKSEETEIFKAQETEEQEASVTDLIKAGVLEYDDSIEKAVYADTAENRKLGRVGQEYHRGKGKKVEEKTGGKELQRRGEGGNKPESGNGKNKVHEKVKKDTIKEILENGALASDDAFIDNNKTDYYKSVMKKYDASNLVELLDKLGYGDDGLDKYDEFYTKMLIQIPASAFYKEYGDLKNK